MSAPSGTRGEEGRLVGLTLRLGAYGSLVLILAGLLLSAAWQGGEAVTRVGLLLLLFTPLMRIVVALVMFVRERDWRYVLISAGVLAIVVTASVLALLGVLPTVER